MKQKLYLYGVLTCLGLVSCGTAGEITSSTGSKESISSSSSEGTSSSLSSSESSPFSTESREKSETSAESIEITYSITFDSRGGSPIETQFVKPGELAIEPEDPILEGATFLGWYLDSSAKTSLFNFETAIESDYTLYAGWDNGGGSSSESSGVDPLDGPYGPEGSELVSWWVVGTGSLFNEDWTTSGGVQLYSNPGSTDKGCLLHLKFEAGDEFKVTDGGSTWFGYEGVDPWDNPSNLGKYNFESSDGDNQNFKCIVACDTDVYVNENGKFWIQAHAE